MTIYHKILLLSILLLLVFTKLGEHPVSKWDEARRGVSAIEMLKNKDWINIHYAGQPDNWAAKPPLMVWCIAASFQIFGYNELALRLPAALAIIIAFFFIFKMINLYQSEKFAFYTCLLLMSVDGLIGWHIGRTGDTDAMLVCFLMIGVYHFLRFVDFQQKNSIYWAGLFFGLAFMTKGPASLVLVPGLLLYSQFSKKIRLLFKSKKTWIGLMLYLIFPVSWYFIIQNYGIQLTDNTSGSNVFERLFIYDIWERFTENETQWKSAFSLDFFFYSLDKLFNIWNYLFFAFLFFGLFKIWTNKKLAINRLFSSDYRLLLLSLCLYFPLAIFLTIAAKSHSWYLAPVIPFVGIITYFGFTYLLRQSKYVFPIFLGLLIFTLVRQWYQFYTPLPRPQIITKNINIFSESKQTTILGQVEQDLVLYHYFINRNLTFNDGINEATLVFELNNQSMIKHLPQFKKIRSYPKYTIFKKQ